MKRQPSSEAAPQKTRRSRNGCNECRRLHRRCDERKPECQSCKDAGKTCSYNRTLSWGGRPFNKSPFRSALEGGVGEIATGTSFQDSSRSFVYGQLSSSKSTTCSQPRVVLKRTLSVPTAPSQNQIQLTAWSSPARTPSPASAWIPWLSDHHRMLFDHFTDATLQIFHNNPAVQLEMKLTFVRMAADTNHGFSLLAAILSLAATHRVNLGLSQDHKEIEYWRDMSIGHLRRPGVQEDGSTENVFAATALVLCVRDAISDGVRPLSWRLHLQGASTILRKAEDHLSPVAQETRRLLAKLARSLQLRSLLPSTTTSSLDKMRDDHDGGYYNLYQSLVEILREIRALRLERIALEAFEANSGRSNMERLWTSFRGRCLEAIVRLETIDHQDVSANQGAPTMHSVYGRAAILQIYSGVLQLSNDDTGLRGSVDGAIAILRVVMANMTGLCVMLLFPLFIIGCLVRKEEDRTFINMLLARVAREHGKANATFAGVVLEEIWRRSDLNSGIVVQTELDELTCGSCVECY